MKNEKLNTAETNFWNGTDSSAERANLEQAASTQLLHESTQVYFAYIESERKRVIDEAPHFEFEPTTTRSIRPWMWSAAASVLLITATSIGLILQQQQTESKEQHAQLETVMQQISTELNGEPQQVILYQDEDILVVANN